MTFKYPEPSLLIDGAALSASLRRLRRGTFR